MIVTISKGYSGYSPIWVAHDENGDAVVSSMALASSSKKRCLKAVREKLPLAEIKFEEGA